MTFQYNLQKHHIIKNMARDSLLTCELDTILNMSNCKLKTRLP